MWGSVNGKPFGSLAGDEEVRKLLQPLLDKYPDAKLDYDKFHSILLVYHGKRYNLECIFDPLPEHAVVETLDQLLTTADKEPLIYTLASMMHPIFDQFDGAYLDVDKDGHVVLTYNGRNYDMETTYNVLDRPYDMRLLAIDMKKNDEYDRWLADCNSSPFRK